MSNGNPLLKVQVKDVKTNQPLAKKNRIDWAKKNTPCPVQTVYWELLMTSQMAAYRE